MDATLKPIPGCPGYLAGSDGSIWSTKPGCGERFKSLHVIRAYHDEDGYLNVTLYSDMRRKRRYRVQRLVAVAFHGLCPEGIVTRHLNGDKLDNRPENLAYGTQAQNIADRDVHGTTASGERQHLSKLTDDQAADIVQRLREGEKQADLAREYGVTAGAVWSLKVGRTRRHLAAVS